METAAIILLVEGVLNLAYNFVTGFLLASATLPARVDGRQASIAQWS